MVSRLHTISSKILYGRKNYNTIEKKILYGKNFFTITIRNNNCKFFLPYYHTIFIAAIFCRPLVEPVDDEVLSDNESVDSDEGCQKLYYLNDGPAKKYITMDDGSELLTFRANRKPAEKYYETIKSKSKSFILTN